MELWHTANELHRVPISSSNMAKQVCGDHWCDVYLARYFPVTMLREKRRRTVLVPPFKIFLPGTHEGMQETSKHLDDQMLSYGESRRIYWFQLTVILKGLWEMINSMKEDVVVPEFARYAYANVIRIGWIDHLPRQIGAMKPCNLRTNGLMSSHFVNMIA